MSPTKTDRIMFHVKHFTQNSMSLPIKEPHEDCMMLHENHFHEKHDVSRETLKKTSFLKDQPVIYYLYTKRGMCE